MTFSRHFFLPVPILLIPLIFIKIGTTKNGANIANEKTLKMCSGFVKWSEMSPIKRKKLSTSRIERFRFKQRGSGLGGSRSPPKAIVPPEALAEKENIENKTFYMSIPNQKLRLNGSSREGLDGVGIGKGMRHFGAEMERATQNPLQIRKMHSPLIGESTIIPLNGFSTSQKPIFSKLPIKKLAHFAPMWVNGKSKLPKESPPMNDTTSSNSYPQNYSVLSNPSQWAFQDTREMNPAGKSIAEGRKEAAKVDTNKQQLIIKEKSIGTTLPSFQKISTAIQTPIHDDPLQMTLSNCQKMMSFTRIFGVPDPRAWVRANCFLLQLYVRASCNDIDKFVTSCSKWNQQSMAKT